MARRFGRCWGFFGLFRLGFQWAGSNRAHCPLGQLPARAWVRLRLASPSSRANRSLFLARPR